MIHVMKNPTLSMASTSMQSFETKIWFSLSGCWDECERRHLNHSSVTIAAKMIDRQTKVMPGIFPLMMQRGRAMISVMRRGSRRRGVCVRAYTRIVTGGAILTAREGGSDERKEEVIASDKGAEKLVLEDGIQ